MIRYCKRCGQRRTVDWRHPGTLTFCEGCALAVAEGLLTPGQKAQRSRRNARSKQRRENRALANLTWVNEYKRTRGCPYCSETDPICLDLHHEDPEQKEASVAMLIRTSSLEVVKKEVAKCRVLCSNCHRKYHHRFREFGAPRFVPVVVKAISKQSGEAPDPPPGYSALMEELRRKCFPEESLAMAETSGAEVLKGLELRRDALNSEIEQLEVEIEALQADLRTRRASRQRSRF